MPRNPNKTRCACPACRSAAEIPPALDLQGRVRATRGRNWAMRDHTYCRPHRVASRGTRDRDDELGSCGGGAPPGNLNAIKTGAYTNPTPPSELVDLVAVIIADPDDLPTRIDLAVRAISEIPFRGHDRTGDPCLTLVALCRLFTQLVPYAARLFITELYAYLRRSSLSPLECDVQVRKIARLAAGKNLEARLWALGKKSCSG